MSFVARAGSIVLGLLPLVIGCADPALGPFDPGDAPPLRPRSIRPGTGGVNGLSSADYHAHAMELVAAMGHQLVTGGTNDVSDDVVGTGLLPGGEAVLRYAAGCALPVGLTVTDGFSSFTGKRILTTADWQLHALSPSAADALLACVIAHVNSTAGVDILLSGPNVRDDLGDHTDFDVAEALFGVFPDTSGAPEYHVWPLEPFASTCAVDPWEALKDRVCGPDPEACNFVPRYDLETHCVEDVPSNGYYCDGVPVIKTTLKSPQVHRLYPRCVPRP